MLTVRTARVIRTLLNRAYFTLRRARKLGCTVKTDRELGIAFNGLQGALCRRIASQSLQVLPRHQLG